MLSAYFQKMTVPRLNQRIKADRKLFFFEIKQIPHRIIYTRTIFCFCINIDVFKEFHEKLITIHKYDTFVYSLAFYIQGT